MRGLFGFTVSEDSVHLGWEGAVEQSSSHHCWEAKGEETPAGTLCWLLQGPSPSSWDASAPIQNHLLLSVNPPGKAFPETPRSELHHLLMGSKSVTLSLKIKHPSDVCGEGNEKPTVRDSIQDFFERDPLGDESASRPCRAETPASCRAHI